jgi:serine-type D-Ala-D-Ala carboxypeptidase/endopeptidase
MIAITIVPFSDLSARRGTMAAPAATPTGKLGDAIELAWKQQRDADASGPAMGLGWMIAGDGQTRWHNGQTGGSRSALFINRELNCAVVVLCNTAVTDAVDQPSIKRPLLNDSGQVISLAAKSCGQP